jgi:hypothetical protein
MQTKERMTAIGRSVMAKLPPGTGFALFVWDHGKLGAANYISSSERADVIAALKAFIERNEEGRIVETPSGN